MSGVPTVWLDAERLGDHVHVKVHTGTQYGQDEMPTYSKRAGRASDAGGAGTLILRADQWEPYIRALAIGGYETGLRVQWRATPDDGRFLWNGARDSPCVIGSLEPVPWVRPPVFPGASARELEEER